MGTLLGDLRLAWRMLRRSPGFTAVAVTALALAIGANTAIFSIIDTLLVRSYPFRDPARLMVVTSSSPERGIPAAPVSFPTYLDLRGANHAFEDLAAVRLHSFTLSGIAEPTRTTGALATANLLPLIGARMVAGRAFLAPEEVRGAEPVVVLSHTLWQRSFGGDPAVVGKTVRLNDQPYRVIGVLAPGTQFPDSTQAKLFVPIAGDASTELREMRAYSVLGRLKAEAQLERARSEAAALAARLAREYPASDAGWGLRVTSLRETLTARYRTLLYILFGVVACVLLIACANIANLLLQRAVIRRREMAIRAALGARRGQLVAQLLRESLLLALLGAAAGVVLAEGLLRLLVRLTPVEMPDFVRGFDVDYAVLAFALLVAVVTALACGLAPALSSSRPDLARSLGEAGAAVGGRRRTLLGALVVAEVTLAVVLLVGAGLMVRSFRRLQSADPGFAPQRLLAVRLTLADDSAGGGGKRIVFFREALERLARLPGVTRVAASTRLPFETGGGRAIVLEGQGPGEEESNPGVAAQLVAGDFIRTLGLRLLRGRDFGPQDGKGAPGAAILSASLARRLWPDAEPLGRRLRLKSRDAPDWLTVVGVVGDVHKPAVVNDLGYDLFTPYEQQPTGSLDLLVRTAGDPQAAAPAVRRQLRALDPNLPLDDLVAVGRAYANSLWAQRLSSLLFGLFAVVALALAATGLYGALAYSVAQRRREIGVRIAMGAGASRLLWMVVGEGLGLTLLGLGLGLGGALAMGRVLASLLFEVSRTDPSTFAGTTALMLAIAVAGSLVPARRAMAVDPTVALRAE